MSEVPHMPTKPEILALAIKMFQEDLMRKGLEPITPTERELKEGSWFEKARIELMTGVRSELEEYLAYLVTEEESIRDQLGIKPAPPPKEVRELEEQIDVVSARLSETRRKLREARETIEKLRAVKVPPKVVAPPPAPPKKPICPAHKVPLTPIIGAHAFPWGRIDVPSEMFLFQCPVEWEYYICEPRKACELVSLDKLKLKLARIIKPIVAPPPVRMVPKGFVTLEEIRTERAKIEKHPRFRDFLTAMNVTWDEWEVYDILTKRALLDSFREWLRKRARFM